MFIIPYNTDAPLYHYPIGTIALIAINIFVFAFVTGGMAAGNIDEASYEALCLEFGKLNPLQWITSNFMHAGILHLIGNMLFLWGFGLVVEGKLGWYRFVPLYLLIGAIQCGIEQLIMLGSHPDVLGPRYALGASAAIYGVIGLALAWAPKNSLSCVFVYIIVIMVRTILFEMTIVNFALLYVGLECLFFALGRFQISSAALHLMGFGVGFPIGLAMVKLHWVDCEGWDLFEVWAGRAGKLKTSDELSEDARETFVKTDELLYEQAKHEQETALKLLREHLAEDRTRIAYAVFEKTAGNDGTRWELPETELFQLINSMNSEKMWSESVPLLVQAIRRFPHRAVPVRLHLAKIMIQVEHRPKQALAVLAKLPDQLPERSRQQRDKIVQLAQSSIEEGEVELEIKDW